MAQGGSRGFPPGMPCSADSGGPGPGAGGAGGRVGSWFTHFPACVCQRPRRTMWGRGRASRALARALRAGLVRWSSHVGRPGPRSPLPPVPHLGCPRRPFSRPQQALVWRSGLSLGSGQARVGAAPLSARGPAVFQLSADGRATENWGRATGAPWLQLWEGQRDSAREVPGAIWLPHRRDGVGGGWREGGGRSRGGCQPLTSEVAHR